MAQKTTTIVKTGNSLELPVDGDESDKVSVISAYQEGETYN